MPDDPKPWPVELEEDWESVARSQVDTAAPDPRGTPEIENDWAEMREPKVPNMPDEDLAKFVLDYCDNKIFTSAHIREYERNMLGTVFVPLLLMDLSAWFDRDIQRIGLVWEYYSETFPRSINGLPMFHSCHLMSVHDWDRVRPAIDQEMERRKNAAKTMFEPLAEKLSSPVKLK